MRTAYNNPFSPGSDVVPAVWAGRIEQLSDWKDVLEPRLMAGLPERGRTILGEPGLGKSALVRRIAQDAAAHGHWVTPQLRIPSGSDPLKLVADAVLKLADQAGLTTRREKRVRELLGRVQTVALSGLALTLHRAEGPEPHAALKELLIEVGLAAIDHGRLALIHLDEIQNIADEGALSQLLIALGDAITHEVTVSAPGNVRLERHLPIAVYLTGLPDFADMAGARKGATFARRFKTTTLAPIDDADTRAALQAFVMAGWEVPDERGGTERIRMDPDAAEAVVNLCHGEPYLFQLAGEQAWYAGSGSRITRDHVMEGWRRAQQEAQAHVTRILDRLPRRERDFVDAMARLSSSDRLFNNIAAEAGFAKPTDAGSTARRLESTRGIIVRGKPYTFRHRAVEAYLTSDWPEAR